MGPEGAASTGEPVPAVGQQVLAGRCSGVHGPLTMVCQLLALCDIYNGSFHLPIDGRQHSDDLREELLILHMLQNSGLELFYIVVICAVDSN